MAADSFETLTPEEQAALVQLARERAGTAEEYEHPSPRVERRDVLEALAAVGIGAAAGGGAVVGLSGVAAAQGTGQIGTAANPLASVFTDRVNIGDSGVVDHGEVASASSSTVSVSYSTSFSSRPAVLHELGTTVSAVSAESTAQARNQATSGFDSTVRNEAGSGVTYDSTGWLAVEQ